MTLTASEIMAEISRNANFHVERVIVDDPHFAQFRRSIRSIVFDLRQIESPAAEAILAELRVTLLECLTEPVEITSAFRSRLNGLLGPMYLVEGRWGQSIFAQWQAALHSIAEIEAGGSLFRSQLQALIAAAFRAGEKIKIYCHRRAIQHYQTLHPELATRHFIHTPAEYAETDFFYRLIKTGPLRRRGWGAAPDSILNSPRFEVFSNIAWSYSAEDDDFGVDPVTRAISSSETKESALGTKWKIQTSTFGNPAHSRPILDEVPVDEFSEQFRFAVNRPPLKSAMLIELTLGRGLLIRQRSEQMIVDLRLSPPAFAAMRNLDASSASDKLLVLHHIDNIDLTATDFSRRRFSAEWKQRLQSAMEADRQDLVDRLRRAGLHLVHLHSALNDWARKPTNVIHAPQSRTHFKLLMSVLGLGDKRLAFDSGRSVAYWAIAWEEIKHSRGEAIQHGFQENEITNEHLIAALNQMHADIRVESEQSMTFDMPIPTGFGLEGTLGFQRIMSVEIGFRAPDQALNRVVRIRELDQWRG